MRVRSLFKRGAVSESVTFRRLAGGELLPLSSASGARRGALEVTLVPMRSLALAPFSFPFANLAKVREALRLQVAPYAAAGEIELFPVVMERAGRGVSGSVWYLSPSELNLPLDGGRSLVWPAPLPLAARVQGTGVALWTDEENLCSILWQDWRPALTRWTSRDRSSPEAELAWFDRCCAARKLERGASFVLDARDPGATAALEESARESLLHCPWFRTLNLSRRALEGAMGLERDVRLMSRAACWVLLMGVLVLAGSVLRWRQALSQVEGARRRGEDLYRQTFDPTHTGRISNPVALARDRIAELQGGTEGRELGSVLADLGAVFAENPSMDVKVDVLRYNAEGLDCTGSAPDMSTVLAFRKAWEGRAALSQLDNTQSVLGVGYRFDLRVRWQPLGGGE